MSYSAPSATQDDDEDAQRRRMSQRGLPEVPLQREMVDHVVDALFDKCVLQPILRHSGPQLRPQAQPHVAMSVAVPCNMVTSCKLPDKFYLDRAARIKPASGDLSSA